MQRHTILMNERFSATTATTIVSLTGNGQSYFINDGSYYLNNTAGLNLGVVNPTNVRSYLNDPINDTIINGFFFYLTGNTTQEQFVEIFYSDQKLSNVFNQYYNQTVLSGQISPTYYIDQELTGTTIHHHQYFGHNWDGYAPYKSPFTGVTQEIYGASDFTTITDVVTTFTIDESYYVPVFIEKHYEGTSKETFDLCADFISKETSRFYPEFSGITNAYFPPQLIDAAFSTASTKLDTILNCFVDLNLQTNENYGLPQQVTFQFNSYAVPEGSQLHVIIGILYPSIAGSESVRIDLASITSGLNNLDYSSPQIFPLTVNWAAGEQFKTLTFNINTDFLHESTERFKLSFSNLINLLPGTFPETVVGIIDMTNLRTVSLGILGHPNSNPAMFDSYQTTEGTYLDFTITLDQPATGFEIVSFGPSYPPTNTSYTLSVLPALAPSFLITPSTTVLLPIQFNFLPGETQKTVRFSTIGDNTVFNTEMLEFAASIVNCQMDPIKNWLRVGLVDSLPFRQVTFVNSQNSTNGSIVNINSVDDAGFADDLFSFTIGLDFASPFGYEAATITQINTGSTTAEYGNGYDYVYVSTLRAPINPNQYFPETIYWATGERDITLTFQNLVTSGTKTINLRITSLSNLDPGAYVDLHIVLTPVGVSISNPPVNTVTFVSQQGQDSLHVDLANSLVISDSRQDLLYLDDKFTSRISLANQSAFGGENVEVKIIPYPDPMFRTTYGIDYTPTIPVPSLSPPQTYVLNWVAGEQDKYLTFENLSTMNVKYVSLQMSIPGPNPTGLASGDYMNMEVMLYPKYIPILTTVSFVDLYATAIGGVVNVDTDTDPLFNDGKFSFDISLNIPSIVGNESVFISIIPQSSGYAVEGVDFTFDSMHRGPIVGGGTGFTSDFPMYLEWPTIGDKIITLIFNNLNETPDSTYSPVVKFGINMLSHVGTGSYMEVDVVVRPSINTPW